MPITFSRERLLDLLERASHKRVAVIGDAMLDVYLTGDVERISPEAPVPVVRIRDRRFALGGAANVAQNLLAIGCRCDLLAVVGRDPNGAQLRSMLASLGAPLDSLIAVDRPTTTKTRIVARSQQLVRIDEEDDAELPLAEMSALSNLIETVVAEADALVFEDYNKGVIVPGIIEAGMRQALRRKIPVVVDPKFRNFFQYAGATIFKPNQRELEAALGASFDVNTFDSVQASLERLQTENLLLTLGEQGMLLITKGGSTTAIRAVARQVYDVVGAGDTVTAYLAAILAAGGSANEAAEVANLAAGIEVGKLGAATVSPDELLTDLASRRSGAMR